MDQGTDGVLPDGPASRLTALVAAPASGGSVVDWQAASARYGHGFPRDYRQFMRVYGEGIFDDFLGVCAPLSQVYPADSGAMVGGLTADARFTALEQGFEEPEHLIGWGFTVDADLLCWHAADPDPERWTTVIWRRQWAPPQSWTRFDCGMVELLRRYVQREIPHFAVEDLRYPGSRFLHNRDKKRYRSMRLDPWGAQPVHEPS